MDRSYKISGWKLIYWAIMGVAATGSLSAIAVTSPASPPSPELEIITQACIGGRGVYGFAQLHQRNYCMRDAERLLLQGESLLRAGFKACRHFRWPPNLNACYEALLTGAARPELEQE